MNKYHKPLFYLILACAVLTSCLGGKSMATGGGGEVTGQRSSSFTEPTPYGMVQVKRGYLKTGLDSPDTLWGTVMPAKEISVDGFWMDQTEVTNSMYRQFVMWVRDSIIRERLADPSYGGDETYKSQRTVTEIPSRLTSTGRSLFPVSRRKTRSVPSIASITPIPSRAPKCSM